MILPDVNLLVYAHNTRSSQHAEAFAWWNGCLEGNESIALAWVVILGFVRIATNPRVFASPLPVRGALDRVQEWLDEPHVHVIEPRENHFQTWSALLRKLGTTGDLTTDSHLAALAMERGLVLYSTDADFSRFPGLKWKNPLV